MPSSFCFEDDQDQVRHRTEFQSIFDFFYGSLFVVTRSSCAPSTLFGHCFCSFGGCVKENCLRCHCQNLLQLPVPMSESQNCICADESLAVFLLSAEKVRNSVASLPRESLATIPLVPVILTANCVVAFCYLWQGTTGHPTCSSVKWEVLPFFCLRDSWMQVAGHSPVQVASVCGKGSFESRSQAAPLQASTAWNIHESPWLMIPIPAALVCLKTCDTVANDASNITSSPFHWPYLRYIQLVWKQTFQRKSFAAQMRQV